MPEEFLSRRQKQNHHILSLTCIQPLLHEHYDIEALTAVMTLYPNIPSSMYLGKVDVDLRKLLLIRDS